MYYLKESFTRSRILKFFLKDEKTQTQKVSWKIYFIIQIIENTIIRVRKYFCYNRINLGDISFMNFKFFLEQLYFADCFSYKDTQFYDFYFSFQVFTFFYFSLFFMKVKLKRFYVKDYESRRYLELLLHMRVRKWQWHVHTVSFFLFFLLNRR
jgi:hypothetical protein